jgi:hypothetical protein
MLSIVARAGLLLGLLALVAVGVSAQGVPDLTAESVDIVSSLNAFGQPVIVAEGLLVNTGQAGYADVFLTVRAFDAGDAQIAEGYGVLVDACGAGLLPAYVMPPGHGQSFTAPLEFFVDADDPAAMIDRVEVQAQARAVEAPAVFPLPNGITRPSDHEIVAVDWLDNGGLRYAAGCPRDLFIDWRWRELDPATGRERSIQHPDAAQVTDTLRERLDLTDPALFANAQLSFAPEGGRLVYQDGVNRFYTAARDGTLKRLLYTGLNSRVLQTVRWLGGDRFLATYYGAVGEPVLWFTADAEARPLSPAPSNNRPSISVPGASPDGRRVVIGGTFDTEAGANITGYYLNVVTNGFFELLFEAPVPGSNYPAPIPVIDPADDLVARVYVVRLVDGAPLLQCFNRADNTLIDLAPLPPVLTESARGGLWLSPDETTLAFTATGAEGGLWLIDLAALPSCEAPQ